MSASKSGRDEDHSARIDKRPFPRSGVYLRVVADPRADAAHCIDPAALVIDAPLSPGQLIDAWTGIDAGADPSVAAGIVAAAQQALAIDHPAESEIERAWQLDVAASLYDPAAIDVARRIYQGWARDPRENLRHALRLLPQAQFAYSEIVRLIVQLTAPQVRPIAILCGSNDLFAVVQFAVTCAEVSPELAVTVLATPAIYQQMKFGLPGHTMALLEDGRVLETAARLIDLPSPESPGEPLAERARRAVVRAREVDAVRAGRLPPPVELSNARSLAELLLHQALEADRRTRGLFALNADGGFRFGQRASEIDLFSAQLGIAVEVDGYFHFQNTAAYRRDRAKDWLIQRQGYIILRFLAEDVPERLKAIVSVIAQAVAMRRGH